MRWSLVLPFAILCTLPPLKVAAQERFALIVEGAAGEAQFAERHAAWRDRLADVLRSTYEVPDTHITVLGADSSARDGASTGDAVKAAIARIAGRASASDIVLIVLIGHGTYDGVDAKFNLVGPDLTAHEWGRLLADVRGEVVFVNTASASAPFVQALAGPRRIVITATAIPAQRFHTTFAEYFIEGLADAAADIDRNGRRSVYEAFVYASSRVEQHYEQRGQLATERALIDDDGDGRGREADGEGPDGARASVAYLDVDRAAIVTDPDLLRLMQRRDALVDEVEELKKRRLMMPEGEYDALLEKILIDLALVSREIRRRT